MSNKKIWWQDTNCDVCGAMYTRQNMFQIVCESAFCISYAHVAIAAAANDKVALARLPDLNKRLTRVKAESA